MTLSSNFMLPLPAQPANPQVTPRDPGTPPVTDSSSGRSFAELVSDQARDGGQPAATPKPSRNNDEPASPQGSLTTSGSPENTPETPVQDNSEAMGAQNSDTESPASELLSESDIQIPVAAAPSTEDMSQEETPDPFGATEPGSVSGETSSVPVEEVPQAPFGQTVKQNTPAQTGQTPPESGMTPSGKILPESALKDTETTVVSDTPDMNPDATNLNQVDDIDIETSPSSEQPVTTTGQASLTDTEINTDSQSDEAQPLDEMTSEAQTPSNSAASDESETNTDPENEADKTYTEVKTTDVSAESSSDNTPEVSPAATQQASNAQTAAPQSDRTPPSATPAQPGDDGPATPAQPVSNPASQVKAPEAELKGDNSKSNAFTGKPETTPASSGQPKAADNPELASQPSAQSTGGAAQTPSDSASQTATAAQTSRPVTFIPTLVPDQAKAGDVLTETGADPDMDALLPLKAHQATSSTPDARQASNLAARIGPAHVQTVAARIAQRFSEGNRVFDIRLDPPELGRVDVRLELGPNNRVSAIMTAEKADALAELQRSAKDLARGLAEAGLDLAEDGLSFQLGGRQHDEPSEGEPHGWQRSNAPVFAEIEGGSGLTIQNPGHSYGFALKSHTALNVRI